MAPRRILVIDDDAPTRSLLHALLKHNGHTCIETGCGREALDLLPTDGFDVVLLDLLLPDVDGFAILSHMKSSRSPLLPRTIVLTAAAERLWCEREELDGVWCVLKKPLDIAELGEQIEQCAEQRDRDHKAPPESRPSAG